MFALMQLDVVQGVHIYLSTSEFYVEQTGVHDWRYRAFKTVCSRVPGNSAANLYDIPRCHRRI